MAVAETLEKRVRDVETLVAVVDTLETRVEEMEQLKVQIERLSDFVEGVPLTVVELSEKLEKRVRDVETLGRQAVRGHAELSVLQVALSRHGSRFTNLEQWSNDIAEAINEVKGRVSTLKRHCW